ncbi:DUF6457 domain-containing protein [Streptomyces sp. NPDC006339]|uniref:DUF6457 domain-containing protein n=1 Tax=Streptomyces sp. NPDC006339 TaxID=3156755 RepID=UPI0033B60962
MTTAYDALVLAGGAARRLGGADKPAVRVGGRPLLDRVLAGCRDARRTVVVADPRPTARPVEWTRESPPGGGPVAALAAGLRHLAEPPAAATAHPGEAGDGARPGEAGASTDPDAAGGVVRPGEARASTHADAARDVARRGAVGNVAHSGPARDSAHPDAAGDIVLVLSADLPFFDDRAARRLVEALVAVPEAEGAVSVDSGGREQPLVAAYRVGALWREVGRLVGERGGVEGAPLRTVTAGLRLVPVAAVGDVDVSFDCDTWEDIATARSRIREHGNVLDEWITAVKDELGIDLDVDTALLLDLARDAAHGVARPAAPLTTFLVGYAAAKAAGTDGGAEAVAEAAAKAAALAQRWAAEQDEAG